MISGSFCCNQLVKNAISKSILMVKQGQTLSYSLSVSKVICLSR